VTQNGNGGDASASDLTRYRIGVSSTSVVHSAPYISPTFTQPPSAPYAAYMAAHGSPTVKAAVPAATAHLLGAVSLCFAFNSAAQRRACCSRHSLEATFDVVVLCFCFPTRVVLRILLKSCYVSVEAPNRRCRLNHAWWITVRCKWVICCLPPIAPTWLLARCFFTRLLKQGNPLSAQVELLEFRTMPKSGMTFCSCDSVCGAPSVLNRQRNATASGRFARWACTESACIKTLKTVSGAPSVADQLAHASG